MSTKANYLNKRFKKLFNVFISIINKTKWKTNDYACNYKSKKITKKETVYINCIITINNTQNKTKSH